MNILKQLFKLIFVALFVVLALFAKITKFCLLTMLSNSKDSSDNKSIYLLDEDGNEFIDDGVTFGFELDDAYQYRNRP
ncbi:hypothetical protein [Aliikangiella maris]|uniref:Uncharacterized protein n=2 Tax=Aliikangiella maris TaxID=3162458 RepID=A0ABV2BYC9_9GAMM